MVSNLKDIPSLAVFDLPEMHLLPGEVPKGSKDGPVAILYANVTTNHLSSATRRWWMPTSLLL
jgi:hypothetical protein